MARRTWMVAGLLFGSGFSALIYQTVWFREFRLIFGASTAATAAVLAIFMGGLGVGSAVLGKRADLRERPLGFYGALELLIATSAALSLPLLWLIRSAYFALGGSVHLGIVMATIVRLLLAMVVIGLPTFLMGGTLPAAARAVETSSDQARRSLAFLYGTNTVGAVAGTLLSTFFMLENLGNRKTLLVAALLNLLVGVMARSLSRVIPKEEEDQPQREAQPLLPPRIVLPAAAIFGFAFLLMELVWYRMLGPLLGGTTFTFGLILAIALLGIGLGGALYSAWNAASAGRLAMTAALEALAIIVPFVIGDRLAVYANLLRSFGGAGFHGHIIAWTALTTIVVFPAALIAGFQFPLLIALLGRGRQDVGRHVGLAYAWNTAGAIAGSLAGGFGLLPLLTAPGAWRFVAILLALTAFVISGYNLKDKRPVTAMSFSVALFAIFGTLAIGPTAFWRHSGIGVGRLRQQVNPNDIHDSINEFRRHRLWDADGRESSIALMGGDDLGFFVNGKSDGSARGDAGTQVTGGIIGLLIHPHPERGLVIGLGTGSTAGWLAAAPTMQRVDVVELESVVKRVARDCASVNRNVLSLPNVKISIADAREVLLATPNQYDIIFSEPSNPYRAGIASLFTKEYYAAIAKRLRAHGIFLQWVQAYEVDAPTLRTIYATLNTAFAHVDTFWSSQSDLILVATRDPLTYDIDRIRSRLHGSPIGLAVHNTWRVETAEGFLSHFVANDVIARGVGASADDLNTDDRTVIEFGFARGLNNKQTLVGSLSQYAIDHHGARPSSVKGHLDWNFVDLNRAYDLVLPLIGSDPATSAHREFALMIERQDFSGAAAFWVQHGLRAVNTGELAAAAEAFAQKGDPRAALVADILASSQSIEADVIAARLAAQQRRYRDASSLLKRGFARYRANPWPSFGVMRRALETAVGAARADPTTVPEILEALHHPFAASQLDEPRRIAMVTISSGAEGCSQQTVALLRSFEPHPRWKNEDLLLRAKCYGAAGLSKLAAKAKSDYANFLAHQVEMQFK
ncbi:MAG TPA: fused MFS/spermidine synthase [Thermoanaerobaculia bacterium]|nr:fused MFS/spermidine synthase [Thermoanaerobaculia bacterium]